MRKKRRLKQRKSWDLMVCVLCLPEQKESRCLKQVCKYRGRGKRRAQERVCEHAASISSVLKPLPRVLPSKCALLSSELKGVIPLNSAGLLRSEASGLVGNLHPKRPQRMESLQWADAWGWMWTRIYLPELPNLSPQTQEWYWAAVPLPRGNGALKNLIFTLVA